MPNVWRPKQVVIYEAHHGALPKGYIVRFLDGDKSNFAIDNLMAVSLGANMLVNSKSVGLKELIQDRQSHTTAINIATLRVAIKERLQGG